MAGIYVHIPFCKMACHYCNFHFSTLSNYSELVSSIINEIDANQKKFNYSDISTIYFGGGTPSIIDTDLLDKIIFKINNKFNINHNCEITIEANPDDISTEKLIKWKEIGFNRISLGVQSFNNKILKKLNRIHTSDESLDAIRNIKEIFKNFSVDLMFGTPESDVNTVKKDLEIIKELFPPHISIYNMTLEKKTVFYKLLHNNKIVLPEENVVLKQYDTILNQMKEMGYINYEISNFARKDYESEHNSNYWRSEEYYGYGPSAHSYDKKRRYWNIKDNKKYVHYLKNNIKVFEKETLNKREIINDYILTRIRTIKGIDVNKINKKFKKDFLIDKEKPLDLFKKKKMIEDDNLVVKLTDEGKKIADYITEKIMY
ncbi:MAG: radical SAM family heme chaperone HemW [Cytophagales bacterium]